MSDIDINESFLAVARLVGFVGTHADARFSDQLASHVADLAPEAPGPQLRAPTVAVAYLQAPTGWRQRVRLTVLLRGDHPIAVSLPAREGEAPPAVTAARPPTLRAGKELDELVRHLSLLARSGMPVVIEKCIADRLNLDALSPRVVGPAGVQVLQRQTLRAWNTLVVWMREYTRSPRGVVSPLRAELDDDPIVGEGAPMLL